MAPSPIRQLLVWSLPSVAVLLSYLWYKKRRIGVRSDTGGSQPIEEGFFEEIVKPKSQRSEAVDISASRVEPEKVRKNIHFSVIRKNENELAIVALSLSAALTA